MSARFFSPAFRRSVREALALGLIALAVPAVGAEEERTAPDFSGPAAVAPSGPAAVGLEKPDGKWEVPLPARPVAARAGSEVARTVAGLALAEREAVLEAEVLSGNVPEWWRNFVRIPAGPPDAALTVWVAPDYLAVGDSTDFFQTPLTPGTALRIAERLGCTLPTPRLVDAVHAAAPLKLMPCPIPPGPEMVTVAWFLDHQKSVRAQRETALEQFPRGALVAGHQKDVVLTPLLRDKPGKVAIYGWHRPDGSVIQPLYTGHGSGWVDYSHGIRLVRKQVVRSAKGTTLEAVLADPALAEFLNDPVPDRTVPAPKTTLPPGAAGAEEESAFLPSHPGEALLILQPEPGVRVALDVPVDLPAEGPAKLVIYALPNGNSIGETMGRVPGPGESFRFGIQHIAAQTRWLRGRCPDVRLLVAYVECAEKSWPAWCRNNKDSASRIRGIVAVVKQAAARRLGTGRLADRPAGEAGAADVERTPALRLTLSGHSGGGAFIFRYLDGADSIPEEVERIVFLDSNYAYDAAEGHAAKLESWLKSGPERVLAVVAYHDSAALLNGRTFVSGSGGTWGRSHAMLADFEKWTAFEKAESGDLATYSALSGRVRFLLMENPGKKILHTLLVERNGFLHSMLVGGALENVGYRFFGDPVYSGLVEGAPGAGTGKPAEEKKPGVNP